MTAKEGFVIAKDGADVVGVISGVEVKGSELDEDSALGEEMAAVWVGLLVGV